MNGAVCVEEQEWLKKWGGGGGVSCGFLLPMPRVLGESLTALYSPEDMGRLGLGVCIKALISFSAVL